MYTKQLFGKELKRRLSKKENLEKIGDWSYDIFLNYHDSDDAEFLNLLLILNKMELGPEFFYSYEELEEIADKLIKGEDVKL